MSKIDMNSPEFRRELGDLVVNAAMTEGSLRSAILVLCSRGSDLSGTSDLPDLSKLSPDQKSLVRDNNLALARLLLSPGLSMGQKIEILRRVVSGVCRAASHCAWEDLSNDLQKAFDKRNRYIHDFYGMEGNEIKVFRVKKGKRGHSDEWVDLKVELADVVKLNECLRSRHRQMMEFIEFNDINPSHRKSLLDEEHYPQLSF